MAERYEQFLGAKPGLVVELVEKESSPYVVRTLDGFEFFVSAEDFGSYYRKVGQATPSRWNHLVTDSEKGLIDAPRIGELMEIIRHFVKVFQDYDKARVFTRDVAKTATENAEIDVGQLRERLVSRGWTLENVSDRDIDLVVSSPPEVRALLVSETCAVVTPFTLLDRSENNKRYPDRGISSEIPTSAVSSLREKLTERHRKLGMKNAEMSVVGNILTVTVDLSKEIGPSKSGKTIMIASSEGNKIIPGTGYRLGLNVYRTANSRQGKGRVKSFKNLEMNVEENVLTITVDLSQELGPSKSGKTVIIASTEGNRLIFGRSEKIGMNVYRAAT